MRLYVTPDFLISCANWIATIAFVIGLFVGALLLKKKIKIRRY